MMVVPRDELRSLLCDFMHGRFCHGGPSHAEGMHAEQADAALDAIEDAGYVVVTVDA